MGGGTILLIDDENEIRRLLMRFLGEHGFELLEAADGREGLELARAHTPDLIVSDCGMPAMTGLQALDHLRQDESTAGIPFMFLTSTDDAETRAEADALGAADFLSKPVRLSALLSAVQRQIGDEDTRPSD